MNSAFIPISKPYISTIEEKYVLDAVRSTWVSSLGKYIDTFEAEFAKYCGVKYALTTSNGTTSLHLALEALGIGPGDEVIVPDLTFIATANAVSYTGATPIFADISSDNLCIDIDSITKLISKKTKAIIPVHLYGHPADMDAINILAKTHNLYVIEDAAEALGAKYKNRPVGGLGSCGIFSFYGNKIITTGEGGMLTTNDEDLYNRAKLLRDHAMSSDRRYWHEEIGFNYRMTNLQAALGVAQLEQIDKFITKRSKVMSWYREFINTSKSIRLNYLDNWAKSSYWMICLEVDWLDEKLRDDLMSKLRECGIDSRPYFYQISSMPMYKDALNPITQRLSRIGINLPTYVEISQQDVQRVSSNVNSLITSLAP